MKFSFIGLSNPASFVIDRIKEHINIYKKHNPGVPVPLELGGVYSTDITSAASFAGEKGMCVYLNLSDLLIKSDIVFVFLPDKALKKISLHIGKHDVRNKIFCHFNPSLCADVLDFHSSNTYISMYIPAFGRNVDGSLSAVGVVSEGYGKLIDEVKKLLAILDIKSSFILPEEKYALVSAISMLKDYPKILRLAGERLMKISLSSDREFCDKLIDGSRKSNFTFNSYDCVQHKNHELAFHQCDSLNSIGLDDISRIFSAFVSAQAQVDLSSSENKKIFDVVNKLL